MSTTLDGAEIDAICRECQHRFWGTPTQSMLGFRKLKCPACAKAIVYPLTPESRIAHWGLLTTSILAVVVVNGLGIFGDVELNSSVLTPGLVALVALVEDAQVRRKVSTAAERL